MEEGEMPVVYWEWPSIEKVSLSPASEPKK